MRYSRTLSYAKSYRKGPVSGQAGYGGVTEWPNVPVLKTIFSLSRKAA